MPRDIVSPRVVQVIIQENRWKQTKLERPAGLELLDDLPGAEVLFVRVGTDKVEVELIGKGFGEKVSPARERFQIEELIFNQAVNGFHIALEGVSGGRDAKGGAGAESGGVTAAIMAADELGTIVGLPDQVAQRDATTIEVLLDAGGKDGTGGCGTALGKSPEQQTAAHLARGVLDGRQIEGLGLRPVAGNIVWILGG